MAAFLRPALGHRRLRHRLGIRRGYDPRCRFLQRQLVRCRDGGRYRRHDAGGSDGVPSGTRVGARRSRQRTILVVGFASGRSLHPRPALFGGVVVPGSHSASPGVAIPCFPVAGRGGGVRFCRHRETGPPGKRTSQCQSRVARRFPHRPAHRCSQPETLHQFDRGRRAACVALVCRLFIRRRSQSRSGFLNLIDIDHFKKVNDQFGHKIGDQVLAEVARRINSAALLSDAVIRWGGEEFLLLSRYTDRKEAHILANRILDSVGSKPYRVEASKLDLRVTCSLGWAVFPWTESDPKLVSHDQVLVLADFALYQAKGSGRNRAVGLLPAGQTVRAGTVAPTIYMNGIPASPVTTPGPSLDSISTPGSTTPSANTAAASAT